MLQTPHTAGQAKEAEPPYGFTVDNVSHFCRLYVQKPSLSGETGLRHAQP
jgi:hypothetical protein